MKKSNNNQSIVANVVINEKILNHKYALKYIKKNDIINACTTLIEYLNSKGVYPLVNIHLANTLLPKVDFINTYESLVNEYNNLPVETESKKVTEVKESKPKSERNNAQARLDKYTAELKEKEAIENPSKEVKHRIASLKRKIARAEKALVSHSIAA